MKRTNIIISVFLLAMMLPVMVSAITPAEALQQARARIAGAKSISADFKMSVNGRSTSGRLLSKGSKFALTSNFTSSWYDGSSLYVYNPSSGETTVMKPSASELAEANPLACINSADNYTITGSKQKTAGMETVVLIPKKTGSGVKSVMIKINSSSFLPSAITVTPASGAPVTVTLSNVKLNAAIADSQFAYPKLKYPKAKIVDLR